VISPTPYRLLCEKRLKSATPKKFLLSLTRHNIFAYAHSKTPVPISLSTHPTPGDFSASSAGPCGAGAEQGVESRERAWIFGLGTPVCQKERATFPSEISTPGKFRVPARYPPRKGLVLNAEKSLPLKNQPEDRPACREKSERRGDSIQYRYLRIYRRPLFAKDIEEIFVV
jgi:hypothetical protein